MNDLFDLTGRVAVVTGAGGGLGTPICAGLAASGADVALLDVDEETLNASSAGVEAEGRPALVLPADASDEASRHRGVRAVDERFGQVDILVNLAYTPTFGAPGGALARRLGEGVPDQHHELLPLLPRGGAAHDRTAAAAARS